MSEVLAIKREWAGFPIFGYPVESWCQTVYWIFGRILVKCTRGNIATVFTRNKTVFLVHAYFTFFRARQNWNILLFEITTLVGINFYQAGLNSILTIHKSLNMYWFNAIIFFYCIYKLVIFVLYVHEVLNNSI